MKSNIVSGDIQPSVHPSVRPVRQLILSRLLSWPWDRGTVRGCLNGWTTPLLNCVPRKYIPLTAFMVTRLRIAIAIAIAIAMFSWLHNLLCLLHNKATSITIVVPILSVLPLSVLGHRGIAQQYGNSKTRHWTRMTRQTLGARYSDSSATSGARADSTAASLACSSTSHHPSCPAKPLNLLPISLRRSNNRSQPLAIRMISQYIHHAYIHHTYLGIFFPSHFPVSNYASSTPFTFAAFAAFERHHSSHKVNKAPKISNKPDTHGRRRRPHHSRHRPLAPIVYR
jgi:hypothetical protein